MLLSPLGDSRVPRSYLPKITQGVRGRAGHRTLPRPLDHAASQFQHWYDANTPETNSHHPPTKPISSIIMPKNSFLQEALP